MEAIPSVGVTQTAKNTGASDTDQGTAGAKNEGWNYRQSPFEAETPIYKLNNEILIKAKNI